jgi:hypothetical protein
VTYALARSLNDKKANETHKKDKNKKKQMKEKGEVK